MKQTRYLFTLFVAAVAFGQTRDTRAEMDIYGRADEISVSPDEKIWLVSAMGNTYYTDNINSDWHYGRSFGNGDLIGSTHLERISFFNKDVAIMTGYIPGPDAEEKSGYFLTSDGGKNWKMLDFGDNSWIYDVFVDAGGNAWMGGSSGSILFSSDFGQHWKKLNSPYNSETRMAAIFMQSPTVGVSGALHGSIYCTVDNWKSSRKIITPFEQYKFNGEDYNDDRIKKVLLWNDHIVVNQNGHVYYTKADKINWQLFPVAIIDFELDTDSKTLFAVTDKLEVVEFFLPTQFRKFRDSSIFGYPTCCKVVNHSLYVLSDQEIYKVNNAGLTHRIPYTTDKPIEEPRIVKHGKNIIWGINGKQVYLAGEDRVWYRENALDIVVTDLMLLNDSNAIFWDGEDNYSYSLKDHTPEKIVPNSPLNAFLASPIRSFSITAGSQGCFHSQEDVVNYEISNDSVYTTGVFVSKYMDKKPLDFTKKINIAGLENSLHSINAHPSSMPSLKDFGITGKDIRDYKAMVNEQIKEMQGLTKKERLARKEFYYAVPKMLDTINNQTIENIFRQRENIWSTTVNWTGVSIINQQNDTIHIGRSFYERSLPWNLPWHFQYKGLNFNCYQIGFSKFIDSCIPPGFMNKEIFDNRLLIMEIANYWWEQKRDLQ
ncbi:hypothetical protein HYN59_06695 [Flavobacterium album]|uniref:Sortilin N-terminal domain-containing protein n=1 Tax=Flavobacterium album TaxID=2175091 RepID=A0A2S1QWP6_9FLAO|nr:hypothetical protein [Flavobacterium album]AWH84832.1 hypothetical protein HYN59_06695 [Flavobacterium album]